MNVFAINRNHRAYVKWLGQREVPLFCIDDIFVDPDAVRSFAFEREFPTSQAYYPGRHQPLDSSVPGIREFSEFISGLLSQATKQRITPNAISTDFSILTTPENQLLGLQGQPHIDGTPMLGVIYLNNGDYGGTIFFRNRETGSMRVVTPEQKEHYKKIMQSSHNAERKHRYITDSDEDWEKVDSVDGINNRLVIWPGAVLPFDRGQSTAGQGKHIGKAPDPTRNCE